MSFLLCDDPNRKQDIANDKRYKQLRERIKQVGAIYQTDPNITKWGYHNDVETFDWLWKKYTHKEFDLDVNDITKADIRIFKMGVKEFAKDLGNVGKKRNSFMAWLKVPAATMRKVPELQKFQDDLMRESSFYRRYQIENAQLSKVITDNWESLALDVGGRKLVGKFRKKELELDKMLSIKSPTAEQRLKTEQLKREWSEIMQEGALPVLKDIQAVIDGVDIDTMPGYSVKQKEQLRKIDKSMMQLRSNGVKIISSALKKVMDTAKMVDEREGSNRNLQEIVKEIANSIRTLEFQGKRDMEGGKAPYDKMVADLDMEILGFSRGETAYFIKYMPHKLLGMVKLMSQAQEKMLNPDASSAEQQSIDWDNFRTSVESAMHTSSFDNAYFSRDPAYFLKQYTHEISQFNFQAHLENTFRKNVSGLVDLHSKANSEGDRKLADASASLIKQMRDMKSHLVGIDPKSDTMMNNMARLLTGVQYFRLMGGNFRSAARNGTQRLYEVIHFGMTGIKDSRKYFKDNSNRIGAMENEAKAHGLIWFFEKKASTQGLSRETGARGAIEFSQVPKGMRLDEDGVLRRDDKAQIGKKVADNVSSAADWMGGMHRYVENANRKGTFKTSYALAKMNLEKASDYWVAKQMNIDVKSIQTSRNETQGTGKASIREKWERRKAGNLAYNMVTDLHFEYSKWAKSRFLEGGPSRKVVGQFLHYRMSLFDMMSRVWKDGWKAIKAGDINRDEAWRLYRLGMMQSVVQGSSIMLGWNFGSLISNDVYDTAEAMFLMLIKAQKGEDDPDAELQEKIEKKTYRTGATMFAGASVNQILDLGELANWWERDENGLPREASTQIVATGKEYEAQQRYKQWSMINSSAARIGQYTLPRLVNSGIADAVKIEFGGFLTKEQKEKQGKAGKLIRDLIPESIRSLPRKIGIPITIAQKKLDKGIEKIDSSPLLLTSEYLKEQKNLPTKIRKVMSSLDYLKGEATPGQALKG